MSTLVKPVFEYRRNKLSDKKLREIYEAILTPRMIEEKMLILLRQGKISKWFSGIGQEGVSVGSALCMKEDEYILPMHRNLGVFTSRGVDLGGRRIIKKGKALGFTKGRDRSFHFGTQDHNIVGMISYLGPQLELADGIALAGKLQNEKQATLVFTGDGGTSEGDFHEAVNVAAVWNLPVVFVVENNGYGLSTPSREQFRFDSFTQKGPGYGIEAVRVEGNDVLAVYQTVSEVTAKVRKEQRPILVEAMTFRMRGHEEASGTKYVPKDLMEHWGAKDPVVNYEHYLVEEGVIDNSFIQSTRKTIQDRIDAGLETAFAEEAIESNEENETRDLYFPFEGKVKKAGKKTRSQRFVDAISDGLSQSMEKHPQLILMGQDISDYGGVFKITEGFVEKFGHDRVRNTPLCESAIVGAGLGLSIKNMKALVEMQFADFVTAGFNQIVNNLAKIHYRWGQKADVVIRMPTGAGVQAGPFHSQSNEAWFFHTPGLKIVYPSNPRDAKGLLCAAIEDPNPYLYFEHKALYRSLTDEVPDGYYTTEVGKAALTQQGSELSIVTYGMGVHWAKEICEREKISADILDLRTLMPWDKPAVRETVNKTGKVLILHEDCLTGGIGGEIAAWIVEHCFESLDAPVMRVASLDTPVPFAKNLEDNFLPKNRLWETIKELLTY